MTLLATFRGSSPGPLEARPWRAVEAQHVISTRKLVDSLADQEVLESILEEQKPPGEAVASGLHYLLATPFRYPPLRHGSRFGARTERGIWYGADLLPTTFAELAYYRFVFLEGTAADLGTVETLLTAYPAPVRATRGIDLSLPPFDLHRRLIASPTSYGQTQGLGNAMREAGVEAFRYPSARDPAGGTCIGVFAPVAFSVRRPPTRQTWHCFACLDPDRRRGRVEFLRPDHQQGSRHEFEREGFLLKGVLPMPAV